MARLSNGKLKVTGNGILVTDALNVAAPANGFAGGILDLADNDLIIHAGNASGAALTALTGWLSAGAAAGWTDLQNYTLGVAPAAIVSAVAGSQQQDGYNALGLDIVGSPGTLVPGLFDGEPLDAGDLAVRFGWWGDANVDGQVNFTDFNELLSHYGGTGDSWFQGDFNYDGNVNFADLSVFSTDYGSTTGFTVPTATENQPYSITLPGDLLTDPNGLFGLTAITGWQVRWGDGSFTNYTVSAGDSPDVTATHTYATPNVGDYQMAIIAYGKDSNGNDTSYILPHQDVIVAPDAPTDLSATESTAGEVDLTWVDDSQVMSGYVVMATPVNGGATITQNLAPDASGTSLMGLILGVSYSISITANNTLSDRLTASSAPAVLTATAPVTSFSETGPTVIDENSVGNTLNLSSGTSSNITSWVVTWTDADGNSITTDTVGGADATDTYPAADTAGLTAVVSAFDEEGDEFDLPAFLVDVAPTTPSDLQATVVSAVEVDLSWTDNSTLAKTFNILRSINGGPFQIIDGVEASADFYQDMTVPSGETAAYEVEAVGDNPDAISSATAATAPVTTPSQTIVFTPITINYFDVGSISGEITASWSYQGNTASGWELEDEDTTRGTNFVNLNPNIGNLGGGQFYTNIGGFDPDDTYNFRLRADYSDGTVSPFVSQSLTFTPTVFATLSAVPMASDGQHYIQLAWSFSDPQDHNVRIEYQGTPTAGPGWCALDTTDVPYSDNGQFTGTDPYIDYSIGGGQSARFRISIGGVNGAGWTYSTEVTQGGTAGPAPEVSVALTSDGSAIAWWPGSDDCSYAATTCDIPSGSPPTASDFYEDATVDSAGITVQPGDHVYFDVVQYTPGTITVDGTEEDVTLIGYAQVSMIVPGGPAPYSPKALSATVQITNPMSTSGNVVHLRWTNSSNNETGFTLQRQLIPGPNSDYTDPEFQWQTIDSAGADGTSYDDIGMKPGNYQYRVRAYNGNGYSSWTSVSAPVWPPGYLAAFDGTWDFPQNSFHGETDISKFSKQYKASPKDYKAGVGAWNVQRNLFGGAIINGAFAVDAGIPVAQEIAAMGTYYSNPANLAKTPVDLVGYSRGAMQAVLLANILSGPGIPDPNSGHRIWNKTHSSFQIVYKYLHPKVRFVGLVSPVSMMGIDALLATLTGQQTFAGWPTALSPGIPGGVQILSTDPSWPLGWPFLQSPISGLPGSTLTTPGDGHAQIGIDPAVLGSLLDAANAADAPVPDSKSLGLSHLS